MKLRHTFSRKSRRVEKVKKGSALERVLTMTALPGELALFRRGLRRRDDRRRQAGEIGLGLEHDPGVLVGHDLLLEVGEQPGQLLIDRRDAVALRDRQTGAGAGEALEGALEQAQLVGIEFQTWRANRTRS